MLTIKPQTDYKETEKIFGVTIPDNAFVMVMDDGRDVLGFGSMLIEGDFCIILDICIKPEFADFSLEFGMGKSLLNAADLGGAHHAVTDIGQRDRLFTALRFKKTSELGDKVPEKLKKFDRYVSLDGYFVENCTNCIKE